MPIYVGTNKIKSIYVGATKIKKVYSGSTLVWNSDFLEKVDNYTGTLNATVSNSTQPGFTMALPNGMIFYFSSLQRATYRIPITGGASDGSYAGNAFSSSYAINAQTPDSNNNMWVTDYSNNLAYIRKINPTTMSIISSVSRASRGLGRQTSSNYNKSGYVYFFFKNYDSSNSRSSEVSSGMTESVSTFRDGSPSYSMTIDENRNKYVFYGKSINHINSSGNTVTTATINSGLIDASSEILWSTTDTNNNLYVTQNRYICKRQAGSIGTVLWEITMPATVQKVSGIEGGLLVLAGGVLYKVDASGSIAGNFGSNIKDFFYEKVSGYVYLTHSTLSGSWPRYTIDATFTKYTLV